MKITDIYAQKRNKVISFEIFPPKKDEELMHIDDTLEILSECRPDYISVTFGAGGSSNNNKTIEIARKIKETYHIEPVVHLTGMCYDKAEIDAFAKAIEDAGIENIMALRGDENPNAQPKGVFPHASDLIAYLKEQYDFCISGACYPEIHPDSKDRVSEIRNLKTKVDAGAQVLLSQLFFDNEAFYRFREDCAIAGIDVPLTPGIMPVTKGAQIKRMVELCGATLPERYERIIRRFENDPDALFDAGMAYCVSQIIDLLANDTDGIHIYTMNNTKIARTICDSIRNIVR
ncbi:MAG: methylenetetrahydrofolate reductase [NAD(P)H] [Lachnospiraceae bacterium]|nr:methylenetetrahydrofolate reductase [NAD(P)H] [Lachnospiraceae bacterium]